MRTDDRAVSVKAQSEVAAQADTVLAQENVRVFAKLLLVDVAGFLQDNRLHGIHDGRQEKFRFGPWSTAASRSD